MTVTYRADVGNGLIEHELVHVFGGRYEGAVRPDPREADGFDWVTPEALQAEMAAVPARYSVWFRKYCAEHWPLLVADPRWQQLPLTGERQPLVAVPAHEPLDARPRSGSWG